MLPAAEPGQSEHTWATCATGTGRHPALPGHTQCCQPYLCPDGSAALAGTRVHVEVKQDAWVGDLQVWVHINPSFQALKASKYDKGMPGESTGTG